MFTLEEATRNYYVVKLKTFEKRLFSWILTLFVFKLQFYNNTKVNFIAVGVVFYRVKFSTVCDCCRLGTG